jgi:raffinose/stachyose/melibiose transport system permease protein
VAALSEALRAPAPAARRRRRKIRPISGVSYSVALVVIALTLVPMLYVFVGGFRTTAQLNNNPTALPSPWVWHNYQSILTSAAFWQNLANSALIAAVVTVLAVGLGSMAAFALARYHFPGREAWYLLFAVGLLFPANVAALPVYLLDLRLHLVDNWLGVVLPEAAFSLPITIIILRPFMRAVPGELEDAATVDGATRLQFFLRILIPLSRPALMTVAILAFVTSWNAYLLPLLVFTTPSHYTLPLGVAYFQSAYSQDTASIFAFTALSTLPALAVFAFAQRRIVSGLSGLTGSIRG